MITNTSDLGSHDLWQEESLVSDVKKKIDLKELEITKDGIRIKYLRFNKGRQEECYFPQRGEVSNNYSDKIEEYLTEIALGLLEACGLEDHAWNNPELGVDRIKFGKDSDGIVISAKISTRNELLNKGQRFTTPRIEEGVLRDYSIYMQVELLKDELSEFYNGKTKVEQFALAL